MERTIKEHTFFDEKFKKNNIKIIDLGACMGEFSDAMSDLYNVEMAILVEAVPNNFNKIIQRPNYKLHNNVITSKQNTDKIIFYEDPNSPYNGSFIFNYFGGNEILLESITIEEILYKYDLDYVDILKMDIEGSEYEILMNLNEKILNKFGQITVEFHDFIESDSKISSYDVIERFKKLGYSYSSKPYPDHRNIQNYDVCFYKEL